MPHPPTTRAINLIAGHPLANRTYAVDFTDRLPSGVTVASAELTQANDTTGATDLTLGTAAPNAATFENTQRGGATVAIGCGVLFTVTGGTRGVTYRITVKGTLSNDEVEPVDCLYKIDDDL